MTTSKKHFIAPFFALAVTAAVTACGPSDADRPAPSTTSAPSSSVQAANAPAAELITLGPHCFAAPADAAAAHARASIAMDRDNARRQAEAPAAGTRPAYGYPGTVGDLAGLCYIVSDAGIR